MLPFVGPSYALANRKASAQRSVNLYLVGMETAAKAPFIMQSVPGLTLLASLGAEVRGMIFAANRCFVVAGSTLYELSSAWGATAIGTLATSSGCVDMAWGTTQLVIVDGPNGYVLTLATNAFAQISDPAFYGSDRVGYLDGYFIFSKPGSEEFYLSDLDNALVFDATDTAFALSSPDDIVSFVVAHSELFLFGDYTTEVWYDAAGADFLLAKNKGANIEVGCIAAHSVRKIDNGIMWIGRDRSGSGIVYRMTAYQPTRVSTVAVEEALQASTDLASAVAWVYQKNGLTFWCVNAPGLTSTWCYEVSTGTWHERCDEDELGQLAAGRVTHHCEAFGTHIVGDADGNVYELDESVYTLNGDTLYRMRISPNEVVPSMDRIFYSAFVADLTTGEAPQGVDPVAELSWSNDAGATYSVPVMRSLGAVGNREPMVKWTRLGCARDRVWKLVFSGNAPFSIVNAQAL